MLKILYFTASWCAPCKTAKPNLYAAASAASIPVIQHDVDSSPEIAVQHGVRTVPTVIVFNGNTEATRRSGAMSKEMYAELINSVK